MDNTEQTTAKTTSRDEKILRWQLRIKKVADILLNPIVIYTSVTAMMAPPFLDIEVLLLGFAFPALIGLMALRKKKLQAYWDANTMNDRRIIILINLVFYITLMAIFTATRVNGVIRVIVLFANVIMFLSLVLIYVPKWSVSGHFASLAAIITYICILGGRMNLDLTKVAIAYILIFGIKAYLWLETGQTNGREITVSALLGCVASFTCFYLTV